jgi:hypothetical protein
MAGSLLIFLKVLGLKNLVEITYEYARLVKEARRLEMVDVGPGRDLHLVSFLSYKWF